MINRRSVICERRMRVRGWGGGANEARTGGVRKERRKRGWSRSVSHAFFFDAFFASRRAFSASTFCWRCLSESKMRKTP